MKCSDTKCMFRAGLLGKFLIAVVMCSSPLLPAGALDWDGDDLDDPIVIQSGQNKSLGWNILESEENFSDVAPLPLRPRRPT